MRPTAQFLVHPAVTVHIEGRATDFGAHTRADLVTNPMIERLVLKPPDTVSYTHLTLPTTERV